MKKRVWNANIRKTLAPPYSSRFSSVSTCKLHHAHPKNTLPLPYSSRFRCFCFLIYKLHHASIFYLNYTWGLKLTVRMIPINSRKNSTVFGYRGTPVDVKYVFFQISSVNICTFGGFFGPKGQNKKKSKISYVRNCNIFHLWPVLSKNIENWRRR